MSSPGEVIQYIILPVRHTARVLQCVILASCSRDTDLTSDNVLSTSILIPLDSPSIRPVIISRLSEHGSLLRRGRSPLGIQTYTQAVVCLRCFCRASLPGKIVAIFSIGRNLIPPVLYEQQLQYSVRIFSGATFRIAYKAAPCRVMSKLKIAQMNMRLFRKSDVDSMLGRTFYLLIYHAHLFKRVPRARRQRRVVCLKLSCDGDAMRLADINLTSDVTGPASDPLSSTVPPPNPTQPDRGRRAVCRPRDRRRIRAKKAPRSGWE